MKFTQPYKNIRFGKIPDGTIVKVWFRIAKSQKYDWAIFSEFN